MKSAIIILTFLIFILFGEKCFGQDITSDTIAAERYKMAADRYFENSIYDSAVYSYESASELYLRCYKETNDKRLLKNFIYCQNYFALNISVFGYTDTALFILEKSKNICKQELKNNDKCMSDYYYCLGTINFIINDFSSSLEALNKALELQRQVYGDNNKRVAFTFNFIGVVNDVLGNYDKALENYFKTISIYDFLNTNQQNKAKTLENIGVVFKAKGEFQKAKKYYEEALKMKIDIYGSLNKNVANSYNNLAIFYLDIGDYDLALDYLNKTIHILKTLYGTHYMLCDAYINIGNAYYFKSEYDLALEYYQKALTLTLELYGPEHQNTVKLYSNIGNIYSDQGKYNEALKNLLKSLNLNIKIFGENKLEVAKDYFNIGSLYFDEEKYDNALIYFNKSLKNRILNLGSEHYLTGNAYYVIGDVYFHKGEIDSSLYYLNQARNVFYETFGNKHPSLADFYIKLATLYFVKGDTKLALNYIQKSLISNLKYYNDSTNILDVPQLRDYYRWDILIESMLKKAELLVSMYDDTEYYYSALKYYQACDTLINQVRQEITTKSDKIALGEKATEVYQGAIAVCKKLINEDNIKDINYYKELAFYFSEKNKSSVLLEALAGAEAQKFAGIPDSLLEIEHNLSINIALYKKLLAEQPDSAQEIKFRDKLFTSNREYDKLIKTFETDYPSYFELKYNQKPASVSDIQNLLNENTAMISYFIGDSTTTIFTITRNDLDMKTVPSIENLVDTIKYYRYGLIYTSSSRFAEMYKKQAYQFYKNFIPQNLDEGINNLIIVPDAELSMVPFETFLTERSGDKQWKELPYLIKKYNISYSYSANLFYKTFPKEPATKIETTDLNDWLAFAPVFDDSETAGLTLRTRELLGQFNSEMDDTLGTRGRLIDGSYISPLPGTESEVKAIFKEFDEKGKKAKVQIKNNANEEFLKSGDLSKYKFLHFATHGFVNTEKPELSGIFLAQDSTSTEDGILYQGEIYNLDLNADLTVLSACETGLGKIKKGEGLIGLTRALLYAGSKNIIVSLWSVADESTSDLMINFYKNLLEGKEQRAEFSEALRQSKLAMIDEGKFAHPFYWSPFILIGK